MDVGYSFVAGSKAGGAVFFGRLSFCQKVRSKRSRVPTKTSKVHPKSKSKTPAGLKLKFSKDNVKLGDDVWSFSLPSGYTCPGACTCLAKADKETGKLIRGPKTTTRCFSASQEVAFSNLRRARRHNLDMLQGLKTVEAIKACLMDSMPTKVKTMRVHIGGDFYSQTYFDAWQAVAAEHPKCKFYAYTKSIPFWINWLNRHKKLQPNFVLTASRGGKFDDLIRPGMVTATIVEHPDEAKALGLKIDHDDKMAQRATKNFALLIHGPQQPGTQQAEALSRMRREGVKFSYSRK